MKKTLFFKTFWAGALILVIAVSLITILTATSLKRWHRNDLRSHLEQIGRSLEPAITDMLRSDPDNLDGWVKQMGKRINARISIILPDGRVRADSSALPENMDNHSDRPEISAALAGVLSSRLRFSRTIMADMLYVALPLRENSEVNAVLRVSMTTETIRDLRHKLETRILLILISLLLLSLVLTYFNSRRISRPISGLARAARAVAEGDFTTRVHVADRGELGELASSFNRMVSRQSEMFSEMSRQQNQLETIFSTMREALAVISIDGTVLISNRSFDRMVGVDAPKNKKYWELLRSTEFNTMIQSLFASPRNISGEIEWMERNYLVNLTPLPGAGEYVVTFMDITERRRLETIKRDFVGNVSHELKTPLTSIKGFLEVLETEVKGEEGMKFLQIIRRNVERMIRIIRDLLLLSRMEDKNFQLKTKPVCLADLVRHTARMFDNAIRQKGLELVLELPKQMPAVTGDPSRLEDMLVNLLDNAVKYTEHGTVTVSLQADSTWAILKVEDTGIGIAPELRERVFERFFVVDVSRSKETGGTGLGLSIVKHIVLLHNGEINVESRPNHGTTFRVHLPLDPKPID